MWFCTGLISHRVSCVGPHNLYHPSQVLCAQNFWNFFLQDTAILGPQHGRFEQASIQDRRTLHGQLVCGQFSGIFFWPRFPGPAGPACVLFILVRAEPCEKNRCLCLRTPWLMERGLVCTRNAAVLIGVEQTTCAWCCGGRLVLPHRRQSCRAGTCALVCSQVEACALGPLTGLTLSLLSAVTKKCVILSIKSSKVQRLSAVVASKPPLSKGEHEGEASIILHDASRICARC